MKKTDIEYHSQGERYEARRDRLLKAYERKLKTIRDRKEKINVH